MNPFSNKLLLWLFYTQIALREESNACEWWFRTVERTLQSAHFYSNLLRLGHWATGSQWRIFLWDCVASFEYLLMLGFPFSIPIVGLILGISVLVQEE